MQCVSNMHHLAPPGPYSIGFTSAHIEQMRKLKAQGSEMTRPRSPG